MTLCSPSQRFHFSMNIYVLRTLKQVRCPCRSYLQSGMLFLYVEATKSERHKRTVRYKQRSSCYLVLTFPINGAGKDASTHFTVTPEAILKFQTKKVRQSYDIIFQFKNQAIIVQFRKLEYMFFVSKIIPCKYRNFKTQHNK